MSTGERRTGIEYQESTQQLSYPLERERERGGIHVTHTCTHAHARTHAHTQHAHAHVHACTHTHTGCTWIISRLPEFCGPHTILCRPDSIPYMEYVQTNLIHVHGKLETAVRSMPFRSGPPDFLTYNYVHDKSCGAKNRMCNPVRLGFLASRPSGVLTPLCFKGLDAQSSCGI